MVISSLTLISFIAKILKLDFINIWTQLGLQELLIRLAVAYKPTPELSI